MDDSIKAWQCIGCGRIEAPQTCIGVCKDRKVEFVYAAQHAETLRQLASVQARESALRSLVRRLATTTPRAQAWEQGYRIMQDEARRLLAG